MNELLQSFLGKNCILYMGGTWSNTIVGTMESIEGNWLSIRTKDSVELINLDSINRIQEKPRSKKEKAIAD